MNLLSLRFTMKDRAGLVAVYQYLSCRNNFITIPSEVRVSVQNFDSFGHARGPALESDMLTFETLLRNFTTISPHFRTIHPEVTENLTITTVSVSVSF